MKQKKNTFRKKNGQYDYGNMKLLCVCGHPLSVHAGENESNKRPCFNIDKGIDGATGEDCACQNFKPKKTT